MPKIKVKNPVVELDGDEMTRIIWQLIRDKLIHPYLDVDLKYYDLSVENRDATNDQVTIDAAHAIKAARRRRQMRDHHPRRGAGERIQSQGNVEEPERHDPQHPGRRRSSASRSSARTCRASCPAGPSRSSSAATPYGDQYRATDFKVPGKGRLTIRFEGDDGKVIEKEVFKFPGAGVALAMYNLDDSIRDFARASMNYGLCANTRSISRPRTRF